MDAQGSYRISGNWKLTATQSVSTLSHELERERERERERKRKVGKSLQEKANLPKSACAAPCRSFAGFVYSTVTGNLQVTLTLFPFTVADSTSTLSNHREWNLSACFRPCVGGCYCQRCWVVEWFHGSMAQASCRAEEDCTAMLMGPWWNSAFMRSVTSLVSVAIV